MWRPGARSAKIIRAIVTRVLFYGSILFGAWWWMIWTPGDQRVPPLRPLNADELAIENQVRSDVNFLAGQIGERNIPGKSAQLEQAAEFIVGSMSASGYQPHSQWYTVGRNNCRNIESEIRGRDRPGEVVIVGATMIPCQEARARTTTPAVSQACWRWPVDSPEHTLRVRCGS